MGEIESYARRGWLRCQFQHVVHISHRDAATKEKVLVRVAAYHENLKALTSTYADVLYRFDGNRDKKAIFQDLEKVIDA